MGMSPQVRWVGRSQPTAPPLGLRGATLFSFLLTRSLISLPLARASRGFLITGSVALPAPGSSRVWEEVWLPPISRNTSVTSGPSLGMLSPRRLPLLLPALLHFFSLATRITQGIETGMGPCRDRCLRGEGCSSQKVAGRGGDAEPGNMRASAVTALFRVAGWPKAGAVVKQTWKGLSPHHQRISQIFFLLLTRNPWPWRVLLFTEAPGGICQLEGPFGCSSRLSSRLERQAAQTPGDVSRRPRFSSF